MKRIGKIVGNLLIISSIILSAWWLLGKAKTERQQNDLLEAFGDIKVVAQSTGNGVAEEQIALAEPTKDFNGIEGVLTIPQIELKSVVLQGADAAVLDKALGSLPNMDPVGQVDGSYAIAGHQAHVFGHFFNRLHELEEGAHFTYETIDETMEFVVTAIHIVNPEEVDVLNRKKGVARLSLITCYPAYSNKFRLVVQAEKVEVP